MQKLKILNQFNCKHTYHTIHQFLLKKVNQRLNNTNKKLISKTEIISAILESKAKIIVTIGAGDIGELVPKIKQALI